MSYIVRSIAGHMTRFLSQDGYLLDSLCDAKRFNTPSEALRAIHTRGYIAHANRWGDLPIDVLSIHPVVEEIRVTLGTAIA